MKKKKIVTRKTTMEKEERKKKGNKNTKYKCNQFEIWERVVTIVFFYFSYPAVPGLYTKALSKGNYLFFNTTDIYCEHRE